MLFVLAHCVLLCRLCKRWATAMRATPRSPRVCPSLTPMAKVWLLFLCHRLLHQPFVVMSVLCFLACARHNVTGFCSDRALLLQAGCHGAASAIASTRSNGFVVAVALISFILCLVRICNGPSTPWCVICRPYGKFFVFC